MHLKGKYKDNQDVHAEVLTLMWECTYERKARIG